MLAGGAAALGRSQALDAAGTVLDGNLAAAVALAVLGGLVSFASPCVLPLVPGFLGYITGLSAASAESRRERRVLVTAAVLFVIGFTAVFVAIAVTFSALGVALLTHKGALMRVGGVLVILLALWLMGVGGGWSWQPRWRPGAGLAGAPLLGAVFGLGMSACTGPVLGAIITLSTSLSGDGSAIARGTVLAVAYSLGMGLPFVAVAAGLGWATRASRWLRDHHRLIAYGGGVLLVIVGLLMVAGLWEQATTWLQSRAVGFETSL